MKAALLRIAKDLGLPLEAVTEKIGFLGRTGSGKSYAAMKLAEEIHRIGGQFVGLDPVGIWYGLRLAADGKSPGLPIPVLGGLHGDIPLEPTSGALIADLVVDRGVSVILDVSQFESDADKARFAAAFADRFFFRKKASPSAVHVFIEECQEFVPQNPQREETRMLHAFTRMVKIGRNFGIGVSLISQRPQEVNKKVLNLTEILFAFQLTGPQERKTIQGWIAEKGIDEDIASELPKLERGAPHVWSPALLKVSRVVQIERKDTFDASSTPKVGKDAAQRTLTPIDLEALRTDMAATIEKAKADDPKLLRAEITRLRAASQTLSIQLAKRPDEASPTALDQAEERGRKAGHDEVLNAIHPAHDLLRSVGQWLASSVDAVTEAQTHLSVALPLFDTAGPAPIRKAPPPAPVRRDPASHGKGVSMPKSERMLLSVMAQRHPKTCTKAQLSILSGYSITSSSFANALAGLRTNGFSEGYGDDNRITDAGLKALGTYEPLPTGRALVAWWLGRLHKAERAFLEYIVGRYPGTVSKEELAGETHYSLTSSSFANALSKLRSLELIQRGDIKASDDLFD